jgi:anti-anti-sigma factor
VSINHTDMHDRNAAVVDIQGPLDSFTSPGCEDYINALLGKNTLSILLDAKDLKYVSSEGIGLLLLLRKKISESKGYFLLFNLSDEIMTLFRVLGFDRIFRVAVSRTAALQMLDHLVDTGGGGAEDNAGGSNAADVSVGGAVHETGPGPDAANVVICGSCGSSVRVNGDGSYLCPECNSEFTVAGQRIVFKGVDAEIKAGADFAPLVVECAACKALIRVSRSGSYRCPDCDARFTVAGDQSVLF